MKKKVRKFAGDEESFVGPEPEGYVTRRGPGFQEEPDYVTRRGPAYEEEPATFKQAFAQAREKALGGGSKTFKWKGDTFTTDLLAGPQVAAKAAKAAAPVATQAEARRADIAAEQRSVAERQARLAKPGADALEGVYPEQMLMPGTSLKGLHSLAKMLAGKSTQKAGETVAAAAKSTYKPSERDIIPAATRRSVKNEGKERAKAMEEAKPILQSRPSTKMERARGTRRTEEDTGIEFKRGGMTASRRGDGIAKRGKTRGKMV